MKTTVRYYFTPTTEWLKSKRMISVGEDVEKSELSFITAGGNIKWFSQFGKQSGSSSNN